MTEEEIEKMKFKMKEIEKLDDDFRKTKNQIEHLETMLRMEKINLENTKINLKRYILNFNKNFKNTGHKYDLIDLD